MRLTQKSITAELHRLGHEARLDKRGPVLLLPAVANAVDDPIHHIELREQAGTRPGGIRVAPDTELRRRADLHVGDVSKFRDQFRATTIAQWVHRDAKANARRPCVPLRIEGKIMGDPGDLDGDGIAVIPVKILATA
jgi:hypothetical protein